jgi:hypothetical protein
MGLMKSPGASNIPIVVIRTLTPDGKYWSPESNEDVLKRFKNSDTQCAIYAGWDFFDVLQTGVTNQIWQYNHHAGDITEFEYDLTGTQEGKWWRPIVYPCYLVTVPVDIVTAPFEIVIGAVMFFNSFASFGK